MKINKEVKVGIFAVLGIAILVIGYNFLRGYSPLKGYNKYYAVYSDVTGIVKSTQVIMNGMKVGQVEEIGPLHEGDASQILITLIIDESYRIPKGTSAHINSSDILGTKAISIRLAENTEYLNNGDTLIGTMEESLSKLISPLKEKSEQVLATLDRVLSSINTVFDSSGTRSISRGLNDLSGAMGHLKNITHKFDELTTEEYGSIKAMFENMESITRNLKNNNELISKSMRNLARITDSIAASDLTTTINNTKRVMNEFSVALEKVNKGEGSLGKLANDKELYDNLNRSSSELAALLKDMQEYPGRYFSVSVFGGSKRADKADKKRQNEKKK